MRKVTKLLVATFLLSSAAGEAMDLKVKIANRASKGNVNVYLDGKRNVVEIDENGNGVLKLDGFKPQYATIQYGRNSQSLYLEADKDLMVSFSEPQMDETIAFEGPNAPINKWLSSFTPLSMDDNKLGEAEYMAKADQLYNDAIAQLNKANLPASFTKTEKDRIYYTIYGSLANYPSYHAYVIKDKEFKPSNAYLKKLASLVKYDSSLLSLPVYKSFVESAVSTLASKGNNTMDYADFVLAQLAFIQKEVTDQQIASLLAQEMIEKYVSRNGLTHPELGVVYKKYVKDQAKLDKFDATCKQWETLMPGNMSPDFKYKDMSGKEYTLADFKGKLVYIDIWATWCGPCLGEIPYLQKLEEAYHGKDVAFVSISTDKDRAAWEKMVKEQNMGGYQLHNGGDRSLMNAYKVTGIPRFILIGKDGKIVSANMSRPSSPATAQKFDELLAK